MATTLLPPEEREQRLTAASDAYMRGEIPVETFAAEEARYMTDYGAILRALAQNHRQPQKHRSLRFRDMFVRLFASPRHQMS